MNEVPTSAYEPRVVNTYHIGAPAYGTAKSTGLLAVLVKRVDGYATYMGVIDLNPDDPGYELERERAANWIALHGIKAPHSYWPSIAEAEWTS